MIEYQKPQHKILALFFSLLFFTGALCYTYFFGQPTTLTVKVNERHNASTQTKTNHILNVYPNKTVGEVLSENNYPTGDNYSVDTDLDKKVRDVNEVTINRKVNGTIDVDGKTIQYSTGANTVEELLAEKEIRLSTIDYTDPPVDTNLSGDITRITIHRQNQKREEREEAIPYETQQKLDENLTKGEVVIDIPGIEGKQLVVEDVRYQDGTPVERNLVSQEVLLNPVTQIVRVGNKATSDSNSASAKTLDNDTSGLNNNDENSTEEESPSSIADSESQTDLSELNYYGTNLSKDDFDLVCAIVEHEGGSDYTSALAVMTCVMNRVETAGYPNDPVSVLTAPGQFESYFAGYYKQYLGKSSVQVREAVKEVLNGKRIHNYLNFRSYQTSHSEKIGGNWYFND